jgi:hypothetical protein
MSMKSWTDTTYEIDTAHVTNYVQDDGHLIMMIHRVGGSLDGAGFCVKMPAESGARKLAGDIIAELNRAYTPSWPELAEDVSWLRTLQTVFVNLIQAIKDARSDDETAASAIRKYLSSWDEAAYQEALIRTWRAIAELEKLYPFSEGRP